MRMQYKMSTRKEKRAEDTGSRRSKVVGNKAKANSKNGVEAGIRTQTPNSPQ